MKKNIREITKYEFEKFDVANEGPIGIFATEKQWFTNTKNNVLGIVLQDNIDKDWSYVILGLDEENVYRAIDVRVSEETIENVREQLINSMSSLNVEN